MFGILNINKPAGCTSRDVVNRVQRLVRPDKAGHAGTLDPLATGVLVVCVGPATRLIEYVQQMPKAYRATFLLGRTSPTEDVEGEITELDSPPVPLPSQIAAALPCFVGRIHQRPPAFSALKIDGKRSYDLARAGNSVEHEPRTIHVQRISVERYEYPELQLTIRCGSGTYVRSLGRDLAEALGTGAVMSALVRTAVGEFFVEEAIDADDLNATSLPLRILSPIEAVAHLPVAVLDAEGVRDVRHGKLVPAPTEQVGEIVRNATGIPNELVVEASANAQIVREIAATDQAGNLVAILQEKRFGMLGPVRVFPQSD